MTYNVSSGTLSLYTTYYRRGYYVKRVNLHFVQNVKRLKKDVNTREL